METNNNGMFIAERQAVADAGRLLLDEGLVARTWGNVSCRTGENSFVITPSGLGYEHMRAEDVVPFDMTTGAWTGARKPSTEKGVHSVMYARFAEAGFVVHTHQTYACALGLAGFDTLALTKEESEALGGVALAVYGLPGTKTLVRNVEAAASGGAHTVLMAHHGALLAGRSAEEAFERARLLETVCKRACKVRRDAGSDSQAASALLGQARSIYPCASLSTAPEVLAAAGEGRPIHAQLDDMAQMIGPRIDITDAAGAARALEKRCAVLIPGIGALVRGDTEGDAEALALLVQKSCVCALHTRALGRNVRLSPLESRLMHMIYIKKYSKKIGD